MLIRPLSDLHLEFGGITIPHHDTDEQTVLVLAGDIGIVHKPGIWHGSYVPFLRDMMSRYRYVVLVLGNHEHYGGSFRRTHQKMREWLKEEGLDDVILLEKESFVVDNVAFVGATMWTNCDKFSPYASWYWQSMSDHKTIRTGPNTTLPYERRMKAEDTWVDWSEANRFLFKEIDFHKNLGRKVVVVTHHGPTPMSIHPQYRTGPHATLNMFYCSDMTLDIMDHDPDLWIHGHVHNAFDYLVDSTEQICKTRVICNPRGYVGEESDPITRGFDVNKLVEV